MFSCEFCEISKNIFSTEHLRTTISETWCDCCCEFLLSHPVKVIQKQPPEVFYKKGILENIGKVTEKRLCWSLFFNTVPGWRLVNLSKFLRTPFLQNTSLWLFQVIRACLHKMEMRWKFGKLFIVFLANDLCRLWDYADCTDNQCRIHCFHRFMRSCTYVINLPVFAKIIDQKKYAIWWLSLRSV